MGDHVPFASLRLLSSGEIDEPSSVDTPVSSHPSVPRPRLTVVLADRSLLTRGHLDLSGDDYRIVILADPDKVEALLRSAPEDGNAPCLESAALDRILGLSASFTAGRRSPTEPTEVEKSATSPPNLHLVQDPSTQADYAIEPSPKGVTGAHADTESSRVPDWNADAWPTVLFWSAVLVVAAWRFAVLMSGGAPATVDSGNWLAFGEATFGGDGRDDSIVYPPIVPFLTYLAAATLGTGAGIALMGALSALAPGMGMYYTLRLAGMGRARAFPAILLIGAGSVGEAAAWGGFPQLIGLGLLPIGMLLGLEYLDSPTRWSALKLGGVVMATLAVTHFLAILLLVALMASGIGSLARRRSLAWTGDISRTLCWVLLPSIPLVPIYVRLVDAVIFNPNEFAALDNLTADNTLSRLSRIYSEFPALWEVILPLSLMTPLLGWSMRREPVWRLLTSLLVAVGAMLAVTQESRYLYLAPIIGALGVALWLSRLDEVRGFLREHSAPRYVGIVGVGLLLLVGLAQLQGGLSTFREHRDFYGVMTPKLLDAITVADNYADTSGVLLVPSLGDAPIGWWVEALTAGEVLYGSPLRWLNFPDEVQRAKIANSIFDPSFPDADTRRQLDGAAVDVMILPTRWAWFDDDAVRGWVENEGLSLLLANDDALVIGLR